MRADDTPAPAAEPAHEAPADAPPRPGDTFVQSFARGLQVIRSFSAQAPQQTLSEVAQRTGLTRAGARRILLTLEHLGYVRSQGRLFMLAPRILDLGFAYLSSLPLWNLAEPVMERLVEEVKESCAAAVLDGPDIVFVLRVPLHRIMRMHLGVGSRLPAHCTSMGRVLLADLPAAEVDAVLREYPPMRRTGYTIVEPEALREELDRVRTQGWSLVDQELEEGVASLSVPLRDRAGRAIAALNISGPVTRTPATTMVEQVLPRLRAAADEITRMLRQKV